VFVDVQITNAAPRHERYEHRASMHEFNKPTHAQLQLQCTTLIGFGGMKVRGFQIPILWKSMGPWYENPSEPHDPMVLW